MTVREVGVIIVAAGASTRAPGEIGGELKQLRWVAGKPMLLHSLQTFQARTDVAMVVCVLPQRYAGDPPPWIFQCDIERMLISVGGRTRGEGHGVSSVSGNQEPAISGRRAIIRSM